MAMRRLWLVLSLVFLAGCAEKRKPTASVPPPPPPPPVRVEARSKMPPPDAELIEHCVVTKQENANTVSCRCLPVTTRIDSKTGYTVIVCKKMAPVK
jgi:hypothetical protein